MYELWCGFCWAGVHLFVLIMHKPRFDRVHPLCRPALECVRVRACVWFYFYFFIAIKLFLPCYVSDSTLLTSRQPIVVLHRRVFMSRRHRHRHRCSRRLKVEWTFIILTFPAPCAWTFSQSCFYAAVTSVWKCRWTVSVEFEVNNLCLICRFIWQKFTAVGNVLTCDYAV